MTDITKCANPFTCSVRNTCYRHTAITCKCQDMAIFEPEKGIECDGYWPITTVERVSGEEDDNERM